MELVKAKAKAKAKAKEIMRLTYDMYDVRAMYDVSRSLFSFLIGLHLLLLRFEYPCDYVDPVLS